jgi:hypothetical protein
LCFPHLQIQLLVPEIPFCPDNSLFQRAQHFSPKGCFCP